MIKVTTIYITHYPVIFFGSTPVKGTAKALAVDLLKINSYDVHRELALVLSFRVCRVARLGFGVLLYRAELNS